MSNLAIQSTEITPGMFGYQVISTAGELVNEVSAFSDSIIGTLRTGSITTKDVITNSLTINGQSLRDYILDIIASNPVQTTGTLSPVATDSAGVLL